MQKLNKNQQEWVDALRSGDFRQHIGMLEYQNRFCCLGVACKVAQRHGINVILGDLNTINKDMLHGATLYNQPDVVRWLGLKEAGTSLKYNNIICSLMSLNDMGNSFKEIADIIEKEAHQLFLSEVEVG